MPLDDAKSVLNDAAKQAASVAADAVLTALLSEAKLSDEVQNAIKGMTHDISGIDRNFMNGLKRNGFGNSIKQWFSRQVFDAANAAIYLLEHQNKSTASFISLTDPNLKKAVKSLIVFQGEIASHFNQCTQELMGNPGHAHVLLFLHQTLSVMIQKISEHDGAGAELTDYQKQLETITTAFQVYVDKTQAQASDADRRGAMLTSLKQKVEEAKNCLECCKASHTLQNSISVLRKGVESFSIQLQRVLFAIIIEPAEGANKKLGDGEKTAKQANKKLFLERLLIEPDKDQLLLMDEKQCLGYKTMFEDRAVGTLYANPFVKRTRELVEGYKKSIQTKSIPTKKQLFYNVWLEIVNARKNSLTSNSVQKIIHGFAKRYDGAINEFRMLKQKQVMFLLPNANAGLFLQRMMALFHQSTELVNFLNALSGFMEMVGKVGLYSNKDLHKILQEVMTKAQLKFQENFDPIIECVDDSSKGVWLTPLKQWFDEIKKNGKYIKADINSFVREFTQIADKNEMEKEFEQKKNELMESVVGLAEACGLDPAEVSQISKLISDKTFNQFIAAPTPSGVSLVVLEQHHLHMQELITHSASTAQLNGKLTIDLQTVAAQLKQADARAADAKVDIDQLREENAKQKALIADISDKIRSKDNLVINFINEIKIELTEQQTRNTDSIQQVTKLKQEIAGAATNEDQAQKFLQVNLIIKELQTTKDAITKLLEKVNIFGTGYAVHAHEVGHKLQELKNITDVMTTTINALEGQIKELEDLVNKQNIKIAEIAAQKAKAEKEAQEKIQKLEQIIKDRDNAAEIARLAAVEAKKSKAIAEQKNRVDDLKKDIKDYPIRMSEFYLKILKDTTLSEPHRRELLDQFPTVVKDIFANINLNANNNGYEINDLFTISLKAPYSKKLYVPWEVAGWVNSSYCSDPGPAGEFKLKLSNCGKHFEIVSQAYLQYPLFVCSDSIGGLISSTYKAQSVTAEEEAAAEEIFGGQKQITLRPEKARDGSYHFIMSSVAWPKWTLFLEKRWDGRVKSHFGMHPGEQGHFVLTKKILNPQRSIPPVEPGIIPATRPVADLMSVNRSPIFSKPNKPNVPKVNVDNNAARNLPIPAMG